MMGETGKWNIETIMSEMNSTSGYPAPAGRKCIDRGVTHSMYQVG